MSTEVKDRVNSWREFLGLPIKEPRLGLQMQVGMKIRFAHPTAGYDSDQEQAKAYLTLGQIYTIRSFEIGSWMSHVSLEGLPGMFNTVLFDEVLYDNE